MLFTNYIVHVSMKMDEQNTEKEILLNSVLKKWWWFESACDDNIE
jgi:hypothetical protein